MNTLKLITLIAIMTTFYSCQENEESLTVLEDQESVVNPCNRPNCAFQVTVFNQQGIRKLIINSALSKLQAAPSFADLFNPNTGTWEVVHQGGNKYTVFVPSSGSGQIEI
ncbi:MAG: hypothetical protein AAGA66_12020 [Bacteroidota bacterium]